MPPVAGREQEEGGKDRGRGEGGKGKEEKLQQERRWLSWQKKCRRE